MISKNTTTDLAEIINRDILPIDFKEGEGNNSSPETHKVIHGLLRQLQGIVNSESSVPESPADKE